MKQIVALSLCLSALALPARGDSPDGGPAALVPPRVLQQVNASYPLEELAARREGVTVLIVTVGAQGEVQDVSVSQSAGEAFDHAALDAVRGWRFEPATRDGRAVASRLQIPFRFVFPLQTLVPDAGAPLAAADAGTTLAPEAPEAVEAVPAPDAPREIVVRGRRAAPPRSASDFVLEREVLAAAPHLSAGDLLASAPGVYVASPEGDAVAHQIYLRGFDAEHGQDIELSVGPVPINQVSHVHGQGYADLNFIIPETVRSLRVIEGVYDPRQGDFAVAGSVHFDLGVPTRGYQLKTSYGSFNQVRQLALWAPKGEPEETFGAVSIRYTQGFGENRGGLSGSALGQFAFEGPAGFHGLLQAAAYGARANLAGVLRRDDVQTGRVGFYDAYPDPSAQSQSALSSRAHVAVTLEKTAAEGSRTDLSAYVVLTQFRVRENFTGYLQHSRLNPEWVGRGDLIEQANGAFTVGAKASHRLPRAKLWDGASAQLELGLSARTDRIEQDQNLLQAPDNETWDRRVDATVQATDIGLYGDADLRLGKRVHLRGGARADLLLYDLDDRLGNFIPAFQAQTHLPGYRRTALGVAVGPRATLEAEPVDWLTLLASYGEGYRSPQALQLEEGEQAPFTKVRGMEVGAKLKPGGGDRITLAAAGYLTFLSNDLAFDPGENRLERIGPTRRAGVAAHLLAHPTSWSLASVSVTYVNAVLTAPPAASAENPTPPYVPGQQLPYVPPIVVRLDGSVNHEFDLFRVVHLDARAGVGFTYLSPRPLPFGQFARPVALLDLSAGLRIGFVNLTLEVYNVLNAQYAATEYSFVSNWATTSVPSRIPARHFSAGAPRAFVGSLALSF